MHNLLRSGRVLGVGVLLAVLCAGGEDSIAQEAESATQRSVTVMTTPAAEVPLGPQGRRYTQTFPVFGGTVPYTFEVTGKLPDGMRWIQAENGLLLDGVPVVMGDFPLTVTVKDASGQQSSRDYVLNVTPHDTGSSVNISLTESVTAKDAVAVLPPARIAVAEGISTRDSVAILPAVVKIAVEESVRTGDAVAFLPASVKIAVTEGVSTRDVIAILPPVKIAVVESVGVADTVAFVPAFVKIAVSESVKTADVFALLPASVRIAVSESIKTTDAVSVTPQTGSTPASQAINVGMLPTPVFGGAPFSVSASASSGLPVKILRTSGPATGAGSGPYTATGAGVVNFTATQAGNANYTAATPVNFSVTVGKQASVTVVSASPTSVTPVQTTTLTANVSGVATGSPTGTVVFLDNGVPIGSPVQVVGGQAQLTTLLLSGAQVITATYSGDANFLGSSTTSGATVSVAPLEFTMTALSPTTLNVVPGAAAVVSFNVTPLYLIYPGPVTFSVSGLPSTATYTITPTSIAANGGPQTVTVTIQTKAAVAMNFARSTPIALALFVPLLALGVRRRRRWLSALVLLLGVVASSAVVGCGAGTTGNGFFGQAQQRYPVVITATSGTVQHTIDVTLDIQ